MLPLECNLTGDLLPAAAIASALGCTRTPAAEETGDESHGQGNGVGGRWWLMLDAAKAASTGAVDVPASGAAFCCVSFYKLFGEPTGLGALLVRQDAARLLQRRCDSLAPAQAKQL